jgi:hypothetical protein
MTGEACSGSGQVYQITDSAKRIVDPDTAFSVTGNSVPIGESNYTVDYLFGIITFADGYVVSAPVACTGAYLPSYTVGNASEVTMAASLDLAEATVFGATNKAKQATLGDCTFALSSLELPLADIDTDENEGIHAWFAAGEWKVLDVLFTSGARLRAFILFSGYSVKAQTSALVTVDANATSAFQPGTTNRGTAAISWGA